MENKRKLQIIENVSVHLEALVAQADLNDKAVQAEIGKLFEGPIQKLAKKYQGGVTLVTEPFKPE